MSCRLIADYRRQLKADGKRLNRVDRPGRVHPGWGEKGMDESVAPGIDDRFSGLGEREAVRYNRQRWGGSTGSWGWRVAARSCHTRCSDRGGAPPSIAASVARLVGAAVRGAPLVVGRGVGCVAQNLVGRRLLGLRQGRDRGRRRHRDESPPALGPKR